MPGRDAWVVGHIEHRGLPPRLGLDLGRHRSDVDQHGREFTTGRRD